MKDKLELLKALSEENRLRIINLFIKCKKKLCVCEITDVLNLPQYTISKALNTLKKAELLTSEKKGMWMYYRLTELQEHNKLLQFLEAFLQNNLFTEDELRMQKRLSFRQCDKCVTAIIPENALDIEQSGSTKNKMLNE